MYNYDILKDKQNQESISTNDYYNQKSKEINEENISKEDKMRKIAEFLGVNYSYLMGYEDTVKNIDMDFLMDISVNCFIQKILNFRCF